MAQDWRARLRKIMDDRRLSMKELSIAARLGETAVRDMLERHAAPRVSSLEAIAQVLGMSLSELYDGAENAAQTLRIVGSISAGDTWDHDTDEEAHVGFRIEGGELIAIKVQGASLLPVYRAGDVLIGAKRTGANVDNLIGLECIVETDTGQRVVRFLTRGQMRGRYTLRSANPANPDIPDAKVVWAAAIEWVRRGLS